MPTLDMEGPAELVATIHQPARTTVADCLRRWSAFDPSQRAQSYLVIHGRAGFRRTLGGEAIADLAAQMLPRRAA